MTRNCSRHILILTLAALTHFTFCDHDYLFVALSPSLPFESPQNPTTETLLRFLKENSLTNINIIFSVLSDDIGQTSMDAVVLNKELEQRLRFKDFPPAPNFGYSSSNVSNQDQFTQFCSEVETLRAASVKSFTDSVENFETVFSQISEQIEAFKTSKKEYIFIMFLHGNRQVFIKERILEAGNFLSLRFLMIF